MPVLEEIICSSRTGKLTGVLWETKKRRPSQATAPMKNLFLLVLILFLEEGGGVFARFVEFGEFGNHTGTVGAVGNAEPA